MVELSYCTLTSFPGSFLSTPKRAREERPLVRLSRSSQKVGGDKRTTGGSCNHAAVLSLLNSLCKEKITTFHMCRSMNCDGQCRRHRKKYIQRLVTLQVLKALKAWGRFCSLQNVIWKSKSCFLVAAEEMYGSSLQRLE